MPPHSRVFDLLPAPFAWIEIPAGEVTLEAGGYVPEGGQTFAVPAFSIAKYPVTNAQYAVFMNAGGYTQRRWWKVGWNAKEIENWSEPRLWHDSPWNGADYPVVSVSWYEALAYCAWLGELSGERISLPTEQQWQRAAQGDDERTYPWGSEWDAPRCNHSVDKDWKQNSTSPVTKYEGREKGDSPFGVVDMAGNVWEMCLTEYESGNNDLGYPIRMLRGGAWFNVNSNDLRVANREDANDLVYGYYGWGFRVALIR